MKRYARFDHTADIGIDVFGATREELFINGAYALFRLLADLRHVRATTERHIEAAGETLGELWVNYLRACLDLWNGERLLCGDGALVALGENHVAARLRGERFDPDVHVIKQEIKAVTYHQASVRQTPRGWRARAVFDV